MYVRERERERDRERDTERERVCVRVYADRDVCMYACGDEGWRPCSDTAGGSVAASPFSFVMALPKASVMSSPNHSSS